MSAQHIAALEGLRQRAKRAADNYTVEGNARGARLRGENATALAWALDVVAAAVMVTIADEKGLPDAVRELREVLE